MLKTLKRSQKFICKILALLLLLSDPAFSHGINEKISSLTTEQENIEGISYEEIVAAEEHKKYIQQKINEYSENIKEYELLKQKIQNRKTYDEIPLMFQTDYPDIKYGCGSVATSGCSISCLAMVATYLTDTLYTPGDLALKYAKAEKNNCECMEIAATDLGLEWEKSYDWKKMKACLANGQPVIICVNEKTVFTEIEHLILLTGITEDGRFLVNDPYGPNYRPARCIKGFNEGFKEWEILIGLCGGWIFEAKEDNIAEELNKIDELIEIENQKIQNLLISEII